MYEFQTEEGHQAAKKAMKLLEFANRSTKELETKLKRAGFSEKAICEAKAYLNLYHYLDDERFAYQYILFRMEGKSRQMIQQELKQKGISDEEIQNAWSRIADELDVNFKKNELEMIRQIVLKQNFEDSVINIKELRRLYGKLARKGFSINDIKQVLEEENIEISYGE